VGGAGAASLVGNAGTALGDARDRRGRTLSDCPEPCWRVRIPPGADYIDGGAGDDRVLARDGRIDIVRCHEGYDVVSADRRDRISPFGDCEVVERR
jgi:hypothetical protein